MLFGATTGVGLGKFNNPVGETEKQRYSKGYCTNISSVEPNLKKKLPKSFESRPFKKLI